MSLQDLLTRFIPTQIGTVKLDALIREAQKWPNKVTEFPVEDGSAIADHVFLSPRTITIEGMVSNSPVKFAAGGLVSPNTLAEDAYKELLQMRNAREVVSVVTKFETFDSMAIESVDPERDQTTGRILRFTISLKEIRLVTLRFVERKPPKTKLKKAQPKRTKGAQTPKQTVQRRASLLVKIAKAL